MKTKMQLKFIHNFVMTNIMWMMHCWVLVHFDLNMVHNLEPKLN